MKEIPTLFEPNSRDIGGIGPISLGSFRETEIDYVSAKLDLDQPSSRQIGHISTL